MTQICRTCLEVVENGSLVYYLDGLESDSVAMWIKTKLKSCVPEMIVGIVKDPLVCNSCLESLTNAYHFRNKCLQTEKQILQYIMNSKTTVEVVDINLVTKNSSPKNASQTFEKSEKSNGIHCKPRKRKFGAVHGNTKEMLNKSCYRESCPNSSNIKLISENNMMHLVNGSMKDEPQKKIESFTLPAPFIEDCIEIVDDLSDSEEISLFQPVTCKDIPITLTHVNNNRVETDPKDSFIKIKSIFSQATKKKKLSMNTVKHAFKSCKSLNILDDILITPNLVPKPNRRKIKNPKSNTETKVLPDRTESNPILNWNTTSLKSYVNKKKSCEVEEEMVSKNDGAKNKVIGVNPTTKSELFLNTNAMIIDCSREQNEIIDNLKIEPLYDDLCEIKMEELIIDSITDECETDSNQDLVGSGHTLFDYEDEHELSKNELLVNPNEFWQNENVPLRKDEPAGNRNNYRLADTKYPILKYDPYEGIDFEDVSENGACYSCAVCNYSCNSESVLIAHTTIHIGRKPLTNKFAEISEGFCGFSDLEMKQQDYCTICKYAALQNAYSKINEQAKRIKTVLSYNVDLKCQCSPYSLILDDPKVTRPF